VGFAPARLLRRAAPRLRAVGAPARWAGLSLLGAAGLGFAALCLAEANPAARRYPEALLVALAGWGGAYLLVFAPRARRWPRA
jgi:hypothetical protein